MADKPWKAFEREIAKTLGGRRTGPRGFGLPDVSDIPIAVECKHVAKLSVRTAWLDQASSNSKGKKPWALIVREKPGTGGGRARTIVVMDFDQWKIMYEEVYNGNTG